MSQRPIAEIIRRAPITLPEGATVQEACKEMRGHRIGGSSMMNSERSPRGGP